MSDARPDARSATRSATFPLTPAQALAVAAMIDTHPNPLPHWAGWAKALRTWAEAEFEASQPVEEHATPTWEQPPTRGFAGGVVVIDEASDYFAAAADKVRRAAGEPS